MAHKIIRTFPGQRTPKVGKPFPFEDQVLCQNFLMQKVIQSKSHPGTEGSTIYHIDGAVVPLSTSEYLEWQAHEDDEELEEAQV